MRPQVQHTTRHLSAFSATVVLQRWLLRVTYGLWLKDCRSRLQTTILPECTPCLKWKGYCCHACLAFSSLGAHGLELCRFHAMCIDQWLHSHCLCPICKHNAAHPWNSSLEVVPHPASLGLSQLWSSGASAAARVVQQLWRSHQRHHPSPAEYATRIATEGSPATSRMPIERRHSITGVHRIAPVSLEVFDQ